MDRLTIPLPNGRSRTLLPEQLRRLARGLGERALTSTADQEDPPIVAALLTLPSTQRSDALNVVLRRFGDKQDVETIARISGLPPWQVWQLEESFRQALDQAQRTRLVIAQ